MSGITYNKHRSCRWVPIPLTPTNRPDSLSTSGRPSPWPPTPTSKTHLTAATSPSTPTNSILTLNYRNTISSLITTTSSKSTRPQFSGGTTSVVLSPSSTSASQRSNSSAGPSIWLRSSWREPPFDWWRSKTSPSRKASASSTHLSKASRNSTTNTDTSK